MKKIIVLVSILFICTMGVLVYYFFDYKNYFDKEIVELNTRQVDIVDSKGIDIVKINDVVFSNISITDNSVLEFDLTYSKTVLKDKIIVVYLYNDLAKNPGVVIENNLNDVLKDNKVSIDIKDSYNNPSRIEFDIK